MPAPVITLSDNIFEFDELSGLTGSTTHHSAAKQGSFSDDFPLTTPTYQVTQNHSSGLPGTLDVNLDTISALLLTTGTIAFNFDVIDSQLDFLRQGQVLTQNVVVTVKETNSNESTNQTIQVQFTGANDKPTANLDVFTVSENIAPGRFAVLANDTDADLGDSKALVGTSLSISSVSSAAAPFLTKAMVQAALVNLNNSAATIKNGIELTLNKAFQGLSAGENAQIVIKYGMVDGAGATANSELHLTVMGSNDGQILGTIGNDPYLIGEKDADQIYGYEGHDTIRPRGGNDYINLGNGFDTIVFDTALNRTGNVDTIADFIAPHDQINLDNAIFQKLGNIGPINPSFFRTGTAALDANDYIVYNKTSGVLYYDSNGSAAGGSTPFAILTNKPALTHFDFNIV